MYFFYERKSSGYEAGEGNGLGPAPHLHSHIEIVLMVDGGTIATADSIHAEVKKGDLFISFPNQVHYYNDKSDTAKHCILIVSPDMCSEFSHVFKNMIPKFPVLKNAADNPRIVSAIDGMLQCKKDNSEYAETEARGYMLVLISEILRNIELTDNTECDNNLVKNIIEYCYNNYNKNISLQSISKELHISRCYVSRVFSRRLNISFNDYINSLRIRSACEILKINEKNITETAYLVGYSSIRTFDRCFHNIKGMTPKQYRTMALNKK